MNIISKSNRILVIASGNLGKIKEFKQLLSHFPVKVCSQPEGLEVDETGQSFIENARLKAFAASNATGEWSLADDSGLSVDALGGAPGVHSARYAKTDPERIGRLLEGMKLVDSRFAHFSAALCISAPNNKILIEVEGRCDGLIVQSPRGERGFGYDPIFEVLGTGLTFAEMKKEQKQNISHRGIAFSLLSPQLRKLLAVN